MTRNEVDLRDRDDHPRREPYEPATSVVADTTYSDPAVLPAPDGVRWGPVWAGLLTGFATLLFLSVLAILIGATAADAAADGESAGIIGAVVSAIIGLIAFGVGGYVAGRSAGVTGRGWAAFNGFLVWALGLFVILALTAFGLGQLFGAAAEVFDQFRNLGAAAPNDVDVDRGQVIETIRNSALGTLIGLALPAVAATLGGLLGGGRDVRAYFGRSTVADRT